jgi:hypothetical protein
MAAGTAHAPTAPALFGPWVDDLDAAVLEIGGIAGRHASESTLVSSTITWRVPEDGCYSPDRVIAPSEADDTRAVYLPKTPVR